MKLYLVRHGETVDNVAGLYAGVRDSALTNHGVEQARHLGEHMGKKVELTHIFCSPLSRAFKTAEAVQKAQPKSDHSSEKKTVGIMKVPDLIEQDFGYYEGKAFHARSEARKTGKETHREQHKNDPGFVDVESKESMAKRADCFLEQHLLPLMKQGHEEVELKVAVVSHGMLLSHLWRRLLLRLPRKSLTIAPEVTAARGNLVLEHLGGWSNTGYLELELCKDPQAEETPTPVTPLLSPPSADDVPSPRTSMPPPVEAQLRLDDSSDAFKSQMLGKEAVKKLEGWSTNIAAVDSKEHLIGLKRQRGGIGRMKHDEGQMKLDGFFKRQKTS